jgi:23S rRNA (pseudouridine1915-N3)-methyltransferase
MKLRVVWIGKTKDPSLAELIADFASRIKRFLPVEITELKDTKAETEKILAALDAGDRVVILDEKGKEWTSAEFAKFVGKHMNEDSRRLTFVIGGHAGLGEAVKKRADQAWSLSRLTVTHDMARMILLEQIYRALTMIHNHPYPGL